MAKHCLLLGMGTINRVLDRMSDYRITILILEYSEKKNKIGHPKVSLYIPGSKWLYI